MSQLKFRTIAIDLSVGTKVEIKRTLVGIDDYYIVISEPSGHTISIWKEDFAKIAEAIKVMEAQGDPG